jgi:hypothetical protein
MASKPAATARGRAPESICGSVATCLLEGILQQGIADGSIAPCDTRTSAFAIVEGV